MPVRIFERTSDGHFYVEWREFDNYSRERRFDSYHSALRFASQTECRLLIESMVDLELVR